MVPPPHIFNHFHQPVFHAVPKKS